MNKTITLLALSALISVSVSAQTTVADFENLSLPTNTFYLSTSGADWQTANAEFRYDYNTSFNYWSGGYAYTNKKDSSTAGYTNLYGCKALNGFNNSNYYVVAKPGAFIKLKAPANGVSGFYVTNSTYAYKSMKNGDQFAKKFGGATGNDPDYFKLTVKGYLGGAMKTDSVEFYLADFRNSNNNLDYIIDNWQWVNTSSLNQVDSITFILRSSDVGQFGMNTPAFFCLDNFTTISNAIGLTEISAINTKLLLYPNPAQHAFNVSAGESSVLKITDLNGRVLIERELAEGVHTIEINELPAGAYIVSLTSDSSHSINRLIKN
ncbi:MAG: DUF4465 domain-containing protein [Sediminibacterium sp.]|nr:DUF4465 domain-containing protein [Sediminibacterium sp.]